MNKTSFEIYWEVPLHQIAVAERSGALGSAEVVVKLAVEPNRWEAMSSAPTRLIDCKTPAVVPLVLETVNRVLEESDVAVAP